MMLPEDLLLAPNITVQIWDQKTFNHFPVAALRIPLSDIPLLKSFLIPPSIPEWKELHGIDGKKKLGEILISFQLFEKKNLEQIIPKAEDITPNLRKSYIDIHLLGIRNLIKSSNYRKKINKPYLVFDIAGQNYGEIFQFSGSQKPTPENPNYLDRHNLNILLPEDPLYTPTLEIKCYDSNITGSILIGVTSILLNNKLPWNGDEYIAPRQHLILDSTLKERKHITKKRLKLSQDSKKFKPLSVGYSEAQELMGGKKSFIFVLLHC